MALAPIARVLTSPEHSMSILKALSGGDVGRRQSAPDVAAASAEADRNAELRRKTASGRATATAELAELKAQRPALIIAGESKALDALERKISFAKREIERADLVMPELRRQGEAAGVELHAAKIAVHRERHRAAMAAVLAALDQLAKANQAASAVMQATAGDLGSDAPPWRITYFERTLPGAVEHWRDLTLAELDRVRQIEPGPRMVEVRMLRAYRGLNAGEVGTFPKVEADNLVTPRGSLPAAGEFVDPLEQIEEAPPPLKRPPPDALRPPPPPKPALVIPPVRPDGTLIVKLTRNGFVAGRVRGEVSGAFGADETAAFPRDQAVRMVENGEGSFHDLSADAAPALEASADAP